MTLRSPLSHWTRGSIEVSGAPIAVAENVAMTPDEGQAEFALSPDGAIVYGEGGVYGRQNLVSWLDRAGNSEPMLRELGGYSFPRLSPDGRRLVLRVEGANASVWVFDLERSTSTRLTTSWNNADPIWTSDRAHITFRSSRDGSFNSYWQRADGSAEASSSIFRATR